MRFAALLLLALPALAETKLLKNFTLIDGTGKPAASNMAMLIVDGKIQAVGAASKISAPKNAEVIDLSGKFVMPGIVNAHGHVGATSGMQQGPQFYTKENVERDLKTYASYGVTTVLSLGTDLDPVFAVRDEQHANPRTSMARLYTAGRGFTLKGGNPPAQGLRREVSSPADCAPQVAELAAQKVDIVKMWVDDGFGKRKKLPIEISRAIIDDARNHHLRVAAHIVNLEDARQLVDAGVAVLAHSVRDKEVDPALIEAMKKHGTWQIATLTRELSTFVYAQKPNFLDDPFLKRSVPPEVITALSSDSYIARLKADPDFPRYAGLLDMARRNLKLLSDAGVKLGFGTDSGPPARFPGYFEQLELELMIDAGLTPSQTIVAATKSSAELIGTHDVGTIERGKWADLLVLSKNPLEDIRNTRTIENVYIAGTPVPR